MKAATAPKVATTRAEQAAATRIRILEAVGALLREGGFHGTSMEAVAARAGVTRVTLYRTFGSRQALLQGLTWHLMTQARLDRVDAAHADPDARTAVRRVLRANCQMFFHLGDALPLALELGRYDTDLRAIIDATYHGRRHDAMEALAARVVDQGAARAGWTKSRVADAMLVLSSHEAYETLVAHRRHTVDKAAHVLFGLAGGFLAEA